MPSDPNLDALMGQVRPHITPALRARLGPGRDHEAAQVAAFLPGLIDAADAAGYRMPQTADKVAEFGVRAWAHARDHFAPPEGKPGDAEPAPPAPQNQEQG